MNCDPKTLVESAKCFRCIPNGMSKQVMIYLLCQWANKSSFPCGQPSNTITLTGGGTASVNQNYVWNAGLSEWVGVTTPGVTISLAAGVWIILLELQILYQSTGEQFPCEWTTVGGADPAPTGAYQ